ncbi:fumarylacetoacetate hydrolase family protein [Microterricola viridarii]|uniref:5-carboxymethyl-2-hydroxymuconate isomerase n=1 Tax=Microterricola viridarii TaxID=412690 RepID=A0A0X8E4E5_9MICO|nr:fumarylacetoacetate hydrolase family protein [Microterricola viridarii]AMB59534.1 5-carboxymethyl-2-hydroxymuconate isomerase [Microterricola viridarii]
MKLARFRTGDSPVRLGRIDGDEIVDLSDALGIGSSLRALIPELAARRESILSASGPRHPLAEVTLLAPIDDPQKYLGVGMNYAAHAEEARQAGIPIPTSQMWFNKQVSCINDPFGHIVRPVVSEQLDYEIELGVVIGKPARNVSAHEAREYIAGYLVANDVSVRDWLAKLSPTFTLGKSFDTHGPIGPWLTTDDEIDDPLALQMTLTVNGEVRQSADTGGMIYDIYEQIAYLSQVMTLQPGDILATGTPSGIGAPTQNWLVPGDVVRAEIEGLGAIENRVVEDRVES